jgi:hypothetical protein
MYVGCKSSLDVSLSHWYNTWFTIDCSNRCTRGRSVGRPGGICPGFGLSSITQGLLLQQGIWFDKKGLQVLGHPQLLEFRS